MPSFQNYHADEIIYTNTVQTPACDTAGIYAELYIVSYVEIEVVSMIHDATTTCGEQLIPYRMRFSATTGLIYMFYYLIYSAKPDTEPVL